MEGIGKLDSLHVACREGNYERVVFLVEVKKKSLKDVDILGHDALYYATKSKNQKLIKFIVNKIEQQQRASATATVSIPITSQKQVKELPRIQLDNVRSVKSATKMAEILSGDTIEEQDEEESSLSTLKGLFPDVSTSTIELILSQCQSLEMAAEILLSEGDYSSTHSSKQTTSIDHQSPADFPSLKSKSKKKNKNKNKNKNKSKSSSVEEEENKMGEKDHRGQEGIKDTDIDIQAPTFQNLSASLSNSPHEQKGQLIKSMPSITTTTATKQATMKPSLEESYFHVEDEEHDYEEIENDEHSWTNLSDSENSDYDVKSVAESDLTEDWEIYFAPKTEEQTWDMIEDNLSNQKGLESEEKWMVEENKKISYSQALVAAPSSSSFSLSPPKQIKQTQTKTKTIEQKTKGESEPKINNFYDQIDSSNDPSADDEFYFSKEGRIYGKSTKSRRGHSFQPNAHRSGTPAGKPSF